MSHPYVTAPDRPDQRQSSWWAQAACYGYDAVYDEADPLGRGLRPSPQHLDAIDDAKAICADCPVTTECLLDAIDWEARQHRPRYSVRGGLSVRERERLTRKAHLREAQT